MKTLISIATIATIAFFTVEFRPSRSPSLIKSITKPECTIKGNISFNNGNKVYHLPGMEDYESTVIDPAKGEKWFCTESEAMQRVVGVPPIVATASRSDRKWLE